MKKIFSVSILAGCALCLSACVASQGDMDALNRRIGVQEQRLNAMGSQLSGVQPAQADMWSQVQDLSQEVAQLKGRLDTLERNTASAGDISQIRDRLNRQEQALHRIGSEFALDLPMLAPNTASIDAVPPAHPGAQPQLQPPVQAQPQPSAQPQPTSGVASDTATVLYEQGVTLFNERKYDAALRNFKDFTDVYPTHTLASNAWFWQGETNYQLKDYNAAALAYEKVIAKFPQSSKYSGALLKQGICFYSLGKKDAAKMRLNEVISKFPNTPEATRAKKFLEENS